MKTRAIVACAALAFPLTLAFPAALAAQSAGTGREGAAATITQDEFAWRVGVIAHDSMQGRDTPSPGLDRTAEWIASEFRRLGLRGGAGEGSFIQRYPLVQTVLDVEASGLQVRGGARLRFGADLAPMWGVSEADATGGLAVVTGDPDAAALARADMAGKHVAVILPTGAATNRRALFGALSALGNSGAASIMLVNRDADEAWAGVLASSLEPSVSWPEERQQTREPPPMPRIQVRATALARILEGAGADPAVLERRGAQEVTEVRGVTLTLTQRVRTSPSSAPNVVGILEGSDPVLKDEYLVFSAHMDHVGMGTPDANGDSIFNGADDDASGTVAVMEVAEAMASMSPAPRRSILFVIVSGEEKGMWGSQYFAENPTVPVQQMVADLNVDMVGRNWPDTIVAIGKEHSDLGETMNRVNAAHPELRMTAIDDLWPEEQFYFRSDHYNFARKGVPILFFFNGTHPDYHGRDDEPDRVDSEKATRITRLLYWLGMEVADAQERPKWNPESYKRIVSDPD
ncbi:MAG: M20/M25/M40 family metallo-hydrolase [Gemmatimonadetes bacterium]|nr:M20/M25/M40 family metallo-hydrolase [Gemmatimonadota bacterium]